MAGEVRLYGAGGHAQVVADTLATEGRHVSVFYDDRASGHHPAARDVEVGVLRRPSRFPHDGPPVIVAVGDNRARADLVGLLRTEFTTAVHARAVVSRSATIGAGTVVFAGAVVQPNTTVGEHVIINTSASVDHDNVIGDYAHISPQVALAGHVEIGVGTHIGAGAVVIPGVRVGRWCRVGAGAVVLRDVPDHSTVVGNPGRVIKHHAPSDDDGPVADVTFVGSGLSTSLSLLRLADRLERLVREGSEVARPIRVRVVEQSAEFHTGIAFGDRSGPLAKLVTTLEDFLPRSEQKTFMTWLDEHHADVVKDLAENGGVETAAWLAAHGEALDQRRWGGLYLPRRAFGRYLARRVPRRLAELREAGLLEVELVAAQIVDVARRQDELVLLTNEGSSTRSRRVVLAVGSNPTGRFWTESLDTSSPGGACLVHDVYHPGLTRTVDRIAAHAQEADGPQDALVVGANATALELLLHLADREHLVSRWRSVTILTESGELPQSPPPAPAGDARGGPRPELRADHLEQLVRTGTVTAEALAEAALADVDTARRAGLGGLDVLALLGSTFGQVLEALDADDQVAFANVHGPAITRKQRRAGPHHTQLLERLAGEGRLTVLKGRFLGLTEPEDDAAGVRFRYRDESGETVTGGPVTVVANCTGPAHVEDEAAHPLVRRLLASGLCRPTPGGSGIEVDDHLQAADGVHVVGPLLAGNVIVGRPVWHLEHGGRIDQCADLLSAALLDLHEPDECVPPPHDLPVTVRPV